MASLLNDDIKVFRNIGIETPLLGRRLKGILYKYPSDFIVGEIHSNKTCDEEDSGSEMPKFREEFLHATLVKNGISTLDACEKLAEENGLDFAKDISYCGMKDTLGITSQIICIKNKPLSKVRFKNFFLKDFCGSDKKLCVGDHAGNHFIITVRDVFNSQDEIYEIINNFEKEAERGLPNFYGPQRFGIRQNNHMLGKMLLEGRYEDFLFSFLCSSENEPPEISSIRKGIFRRFGNWEECLSLAKCSEAMADESGILERLKNGSGMKEAIDAMKLSSFMVHSYSSFIFNKVLSIALAEGMGNITLYKIGKNTDSSEIDNDFYRTVFREENISLGAFKRTQFDITGHMRRALLRPTNFSYKIEGNTIKLEFGLGVGEYASMLLHLLVDSGSIKLC